MASSLSPSAIYQIIVLLENNDRPASKKKKKRTCPRQWIAEFELQDVNTRWEKVCKLYRYTKPNPPLDYLDSLELALVLKGEVDDKDAFNASQKEPTYLDMTIFTLCRLGANRLAEVWPQAYRTHLPCYGCITVETVEESSITRRRFRQIDLDLEDPVETVDFAAEKFHVSSASFGKLLTVELHYELEEGMYEGEREQSSSIYKIAIRLSNETFSAQARLPAGYASRSRATLLLLPEFALEVLGFLDRAHIGSSLLANRRVHNLIHQLKQRLPVHRLTCGLDKEFLGTGWVLAVRQIQRDLPYTDVRRFSLPSTAGAANDCTLIRNYLSNSHVADLRLPPNANDVVLFPFVIKMLASLAACNVSVGRAELRSWDQRMSDYRSLDAIFGGLLMSELYLCCAEHRFVELVKTTDFLRLSAIQGLRELKLYLAFERGEITDTVEHFQFKLTSSKGMNFAFNRDNLLVSGMKVEGTDEEDSFPDIEWDVYRFRNAITSEYLTACVGRTSSDSVDNTLHIVKGDVYPDVSFADVFDF